MLEATQYKCNCCNELSYISVHQLTIRSFVLERKKKDEKNDCCHSANNQIKGPELFQQSFHRLQWQPGNKEHSSVLLIKKNINIGMTMSDLFIFHQFCSCRNCWKCTQLLYRTIVWLGCLCETIFPKYCITIWKRKHKKSRLENKIFFSSS